MIVLAVVIKSGTGVHRRIVMLKAFKRILRNPDTNVDQLIIKKNATYHEVDVEIEMMKRIRRAVRIIVITILSRCFDCYVE